MARGWESKSVQEQIEARGRPAHPSNEQPDPKQLALQREKELLELSRTRVLQDLALAQNENYRALLNRSLAYLDEKLRSLQNT